MAVVDPRVKDVLDFLTSRGFSRAAAALRDDALARGAGLDLDLDLHDSRPPPVRVNTENRRASSSSSSDDAFISMGSSPSELLNPSALWSPARARSEDSSVRHSEFGTARAYHDPNLFDHTPWYDDQFDFYLNDTHFFTPSTAGCPREDTFVMSIEAEEQFKTGRNFVDDKHYCSFPAGNCCGGSKEHRASGQSRNPSSSVYERYLIMDDQTERLEECGVSQYQCKQLHVDSIHDQKLLQEKKSLEPDSGSTSDRNDGISSKYILKESFLEIMNDQVLRRDGNMHNFEKKTIQPSRDDSNHTRDQGTITKEFHDPGLAGIWNEDHHIIDELQGSNFHEDEYEIFDLRIIHRKNRTGFEVNKDLPIVLNSVIGGRYYVTEYLGSAAFSTVVQAHDLHTGVNVCLKIVKNDKDFFDQSLDEIKLLKVVNRNDPADERHLLRLYDYFYHQEHLFIVCELLRANLYEFQKYNQESGGEVYFTLPRIQAIARQCLEALEYLHHLGIIHCDLKPENILIKSYSKCEIKVIDLGSSCFQTDNLCLYVQSRSYRAPEVILGLSYDKKIDLWSLGCVLAELYSGDVLFPNESLVMMLARMIGMLGPIDMEMLSTGLETHKYFTDEFDLYHRNEETDEIEYLIPEKSSLAWELQVSDILFLDFLQHLLQINPQRRPTAIEALQHPWLSISYH